MKIEHESVVCRFGSTRSQSKRLRRYNSHQIPFHKARYLNRKDEKLPILREHSSAERTIKKISRKT